MESVYKKNLIKLNVIRLFFWMHFYAAVLVPFYTQWGGIKLSQVFFLNAWFMFWNFVLEVPTGAIADVFGRKASILLGYVFGAAASLLYVSHPGMPTFLAAEFIFAVAYTLHSGADESMAYDSLIQTGETEKARNFLSRMESFRLAGILAAAPIGSFVAVKLGLQWPMAFYVIPSTIGFFVALTLKEPPIVSEKQTGKVSYFKTIQTGLSFFLNHKLLLLFTIEIALTHAFAWTSIWLYQPVLMRSGVPIFYFGFVNAGTLIGQLIFLANVERIEKFLPSKRVLLLGGSVIAGIAYCLLSVITFVPLVVILIITAFAFGLTRIALFNAYIHKHTPSEQRATVLSASSMLRTLAIVIVNPLTGILADRSLTAVLLVLGGLLILFPFLSRLEEKHLEN